VCKWNTVSGWRNMGHVIVAAARNFSGMTSVRSLPFVLCLLHITLHCLISNSLSTLTPWSEGRVLAIGSLLQFPDVLLRFANTFHCPAPCPMTMFPCFDFWTRTLPFTKFSTSYAVGCRPDDALFTFLPWVLKTWRTHKLALFNAESWITHIVYILEKYSFLHSIMSYDRPIASSKESSHRSAIHCFLFQRPVSSRFLKFIQYLLTSSSSSSRSIHWVHGLATGMDERM
jgi:hypothetical protein